MAESRLGAFVLQHRYRIRAGEFDQYIELIAQVRDWYVGWGLGQFEVWRDADDPCRITEVQGYDSWSHYMRLNKRALPPKIKEIYHDLEQILEDGFGGVETSTWDPAELPEFEG